MKKVLKIVLNGFLQMSVFSFLIGWLLSVPSEMGPSLHSAELLELFLRFVENNV